MGKKDVAGIALGNSSSTEISLGRGDENISLINSRLKQVLISYLTKNPTSQYIIQIDQVDDNYNVYLDNKPYFQAIISLFKSVYDINQTFRQARIKAKVVVYLRSDIYNSINSFDAESARWDRYKLHLSYVITNRTDWKKAPLLQIINKRISTSIEDLYGHQNPFGVVFDNDIIRLEENRHLQDVFKYIIHRTFHRPRDVIQFCICIQDECKKLDSLNSQVVMNAEKIYSLWLLKELENELAPIIGKMKDLYDLLRLLGRRPFPISDFKLKYHKFKDSFKYGDEDLLQILYGFGVVHNINFSADGQMEMFSVIRNESSVLNRDLKVELHPGFALGLHTSKLPKML